MIHRESGREKEREQIQSGRDTDKEEEEKKKKNRAGGEMGTSRHFWKVKINMKIKLLLLKRANVLLLFSGVWRKEIDPYMPSNESSWQFRRHRRLRFNPWIGKIPWSGKWQPTPLFLPGKFHGQRSLVGFSSWDPKELVTTEHTHTEVKRTS